MLAALLSLTIAFAPSTLGPPCVHSASAAASSVVCLAKGFGKAPPPPPKKPKPTKSSGSARRDAASAAMDDMKAQGLPEYMVLVREVPAGGEPGKWLPVGGMTVPRSSSESVALSMAIFNNEDDLLKGFFRNYPAMKDSTNPFEYGYRLKEFADDPVKIASKEATEQNDNPLRNWFNALDNPLNDGSGWFNPLARK